MGLSLGTLYIRKYATVVSGGGHAGFLVFSINSSLAGA